MVAVGEIRRTGSKLDVWNGGEWQPTLHIQGNHQKTWDYIGKHHVRELLTDGPAGTGKSLASAGLAHAILDEFPGTQFLVCRQVRASLADSWLATYEDEILRPMGREDLLTGAQRRNRLEYLYPNGSRLVVGGLNFPERLFSTSWNGIFIIEAMEIPTSSPWIKFSRALRWKYGMRGWKHLFLYGETNPDAKSHWIWKRWQERYPNGHPITYRVRTRHTDNPAYYDAQLGRWTGMGKEYVLRRLRYGLSGIHKERLYYGRWSATEGAIFVLWDEDIHVSSGSVEMDGLWADGRPRWVVHHNGGRHVLEFLIAGQDFGMSDTHPGALVIAGVDGEGRVWIVDQVMRVGLDHDEWAAIAQEKFDLWRFRHIVCDHDKDAIRRINRKLGHQGAGADEVAIPAWKNPGSVELSIGEMNARMRPPIPGSGASDVPLFMVMRESLRHSPDGRCMTLDRPHRLEDEIPLYRWDLRLRSDPSMGYKNMPHKDADDAIDATRYLLMWLAQNNYRASRHLIQRTFEAGTFGATFGDLARDMRADLQPVDTDWTMKL